MKRFLLSLGVAAMAATSLFAETKTVTIANTNVFTNAKGETYNFSTYDVWNYSVDGATFEYKGQKRTATSPINLAAGAERYFSLTACPENCTLSTLSVPNYSDGGWWFTLCYSDQPITWSNKASANSVVISQEKPVAVNFKELTNGANAKYFLIYNHDSNTYGLKVPITVTFEEAAAAPAVKLDAPTLDGLGMEFEANGQIPAGQMMFFTNPNELGGTVMAATYANGAWGEYAALEGWDGVTLNGNPGEQVGVRAYVAGDGTTTLDSDPVEYMFTLMAKYDFPSFTYGAEVFEGATGFKLTTAVAGSKLTIVNPDPQGYIHYEFEETVGDGELGQNVEITLPEGLVEEGWPLRLSATVQGEAKAESAAAEMYIYNIQLQAPAITDYMGESLRRGATIKSGSIVYFTNPNTKGQVYVAQVLGEEAPSYTQVNVEDGVEVYGLPGQTIAIMAYVKGDALSLDSNVATAFVTIADNWANPSFSYEGVNYTATENELATAKPASFVLVVNPEKTEGEEGSLVVTTTYGETTDTLYGEPGMDMEVELPSTALEADTYFIIEAKVAGAGKSDSEVVALYVMSIDTNTGVATIEAANDAVYFNLQGVQIAKPERGAYIVVRNGKAVKAVK